MKLNHPSLDASVDVDSSDVKKWLRAGWVDARPKPKPKPMPEPVKEPESK